MVNFRPKQLRNHTRLGSKAPKGGEYIFANAYIEPICKGGPLIYWSDVLGEQGRIKELKWLYVDHPKKFCFVHN